MFGILLFFSAGVDFPAVTVGAESNFSVCVLQCDVVAAVIVAGEFEQFSDPVAVVVALQTHLQAEGQLRRYDVAGDGQQFSISGVVGEHDHVVHFKCKLGEVPANFRAYDPGVVEIPLKRSPYIAVDGVRAASEAIADA